MDKTLYEPFNFPMEVKLSKVKLVWGKGVWEKGSGSSREFVGGTLLYLTLPPGWEN
jgi:hypothetical protein